MTERIIRRLAEITGLASRLELDGRSGISIYPEETEIKERFCDGGMLVSARLRLRLKGRDPQLLFKTAENACSAADSSDEETAVYRTAVPPKLEAGTESGVYTVSCVITADYIKEVSDEDSF
ncbi:MAG: hypothetical protein IJ007_07375 [Oscillospiraceae bacterium]|nr:hypothetical protein [Oscillospiraceae bacterium]